MSKQTLSVEQMKHLQESGLELKETLLYWARYIDTRPRAANHYGKWILVKGKGLASVGLAHWEYVPAYTLQDVLDLLPITISPLKNDKFEDKKYELRIKRMVFRENRIMYAVLYEKEDYIDWYVLYSDPSLIDAAYGMLCWCIGQGYIKTRKEERP